MQIVIQLTCSIFCHLYVESDLFLSSLQHHLFHIWNANDDQGIFCEMAAKQNPGSYRDDKKRPLIPNWTMQILVGMVCFALAPQYIQGHLC